MINNPPDGWDEMSYGEREAWRQGQRTRDARDEGAWERVSEGDQVRTPEGWVGVVVEKEPDGRYVYVESWERGGTFRASQLERPGGGSGTSITGGL